MRSCHCKYVSLICEPIKFLTFLPHICVTDHVDPSLNATNMGIEIVFLLLKVIGCSNLRGGGGELGTNKNFDLWLRLLCTKLKLKHAI